MFRSLISKIIFKHRSKLASNESAKAARLAHVFAIAKYVWGSEEKARAFLNTPHALLEDQTPLTVAMTKLGAKRVEDVLWKLFYGIPA